MQRVLYPYIEEAVKKEKSSAPRGDDGVDRHGQPVFVLDGEGPTKIKRLVIPMSDVNSPSPSHTSSLLPLMQGISACKTQVLYLGR